MEAGEGKYDQNKVITRERFVVDEAVTLFGNYRMRLFDAKYVPFLCNFSELHHKEIIIIDSISSLNETQLIQTNVEENSMDILEKSHEYGGSPLKFEFLTLSKLEKANKKCQSDSSLIAHSFFPCNPLSFNAARDVISRINVSDWIFDVESFGDDVSAWAISDAKDPYKTVFTGVFKSENEIKCYSLKAYGRGSPDLKDKLILNEKFFENCEREMVARCKNEIVSELPNVAKDFNERISATMELNLKWKCTSIDLLSISPSSATFYVHLNPGWLDDRMPLYKLAVELRHILALGQALRTREMDWDKALSNFPIGSVVENVKSLLLGFKDEKSTEGAADSDEYYDFTERLWLIMRCINSNALLIEVLKMIFNSLRMDTLKVMLHPDNRTTLAQLVRGALTKDFILPRLEGLTPIQLLLEIGLDYFRRICMRNFVKNEYASVAELNVFFNRACSIATEDQADLVFLFFNALVVITACREYLKLDNHQIRLLSRFILNRYNLMKISPTVDGVQLESLQSFSFDLDNKVNLADIAAVRQIKKAVHWTVETTYLNGEKIVAKTMADFSRNINLSFLLEEDLNLWTERLSISKKSDETKTCENQENEDVSLSAKPLQNRGLKIEEYFCSFLVMYCHEC